MVESVLVALAGAAAGCVFAWMELKGLIALLPQFTFPDEADIRMNTPVLLATLAAALLTALLFGLAPALGRGPAGFERSVEDHRTRQQRIPAGTLAQRADRQRSGAVAGAAGGRGPVDAQLFPAAQRGSRLPPGEGAELRKSSLPAKQYATPEQQIRFLRDLLPRLQRFAGRYRGGRRSRLSSLRWNQYGF